MMTNLSGLPWRFRITLAIDSENLLWRAVIASTIQDWLSGSLRLKRQAEQYLFENSRDLSLVCESAGMNIGVLRARLNKVRGQTILNLLPAAA
jgi:hypothetical protein